MNVGRNEPCPCGSGKKYKKCCINKEKYEVPDRKVKKENREIDEEMLFNLFYGVQDLLLRSKPHIKEYKRIRKLHGEIIDSMMNYYDSGKFELKFNSEQTIQEILNDKDTKIIDSHFDTSTEIGAQAIANIMIYKNSKNMSCITEDFINKNKFRKPEKIEFLNSMLNSVAGLFEVVKTDKGLGQVYLKDILTNKEYCITDIGLSGNLNNERIYIYTRIINYKDINFGTGLNLIFNKKDTFICKWIEENLKEYDKKEEITRFMELYNEYQRDNKGMIAKVHSYN